MSKKKKEEFYDKLQEDYEDQQKPYAQYLTNFSVMFLIIGCNKGISLCLCKVYAISKSVCILLLLVDV